MDTNGQFANVRIARRTAECPALGVIRQPAGKRLAIGRLRGDAQRIRHIHIGEGACRQRERQRRPFDDGLVGNGFHQDRCIVGITDLDFKAIADRQPRLVGGRDPDGHDARRVIVGRTAERARLGVETQPGGQRLAVGKGRIQLERIARVRIDKGIGRERQDKSAVLGGLLVSNRCRYGGRPIGLGRQRRSVPDRPVGEFDTLDAMTASGRPAGDDLLAVIQAQHHAPGRMVDSDIAFLDTRFEHDGVNAASRFQVFTDVILTLADAEYVAVVAPATLQEVIARSPIQTVIALVADQFVAQLITSGIQGRTGQGQCLDIGRQGVVEGGNHLVIAAVEVFHDGVTGVIHEVGVVAQATDHPVCALGPV